MKLKTVKQIIRLSISYVLDIHFKRHLIHQFLHFLLKAEHWHRMREYLRNNRKYLKALKAQDTMSFVRDCLVKLCLELFVKAFVYQATVAKHSQYYIYCSVRY